MTKTNRYTLIATILLGVLLFTIVQFANDLDVAWDGTRIEPEQPADRSVSTFTADPDAALGTAGLEASTARAAADRWRQARGLPADSYLTANTPVIITQAAVTQAQAEQLRFDDLPTALALFNKAAEQGSAYALLRIAALLEALAATTSDAPDTIAMLSVADGPDLRLSALGYILTALRVAGPPLADIDLVAGIDRLLPETTLEQRSLACQWSERRLLDLARARAKQGVRTISTDTPPVFLTAPGAIDSLPCGDIGASAKTLLAESGCAAQPFRSADNGLHDLWICTGPASR